MSRFSFVSCFLVAVVFVVVHAEDELFVQVKNGVLRGKRMETKNGRGILGYLGIPYAKPPIGELRFKPPVRADFWTGVKDATEVHGVCPQRNVFTRSNVMEGDEDCLYLNVYRPEPSKDDQKKLLPVMVFLHGGGWLCGSGNTHWYGPNVLLDRDVVLVIPNYRLGALGFLSTGDEVVPGNNALKDQVLALEWVKENIEKFGGDPNMVTIFGESAGGASVHLLMMSPLSKGLFHYGISESGTALCPWAFAPKDQGVRHSKHLAKVLKCPTDSSKKMVDCLRKVDPMKIVEQDGEFMLWDKDPIVPFKPVIEPKHKGAFIDEHPVDLIKSGKVHDIPWLLGLNTGDGALRTAGIFGVPRLLQELAADFNNKIAISMQFHETSDDPDGVAEQLREYYLGDKKFDDNIREELTDMYTDGWFLSGIDQAILLHKKYAKHPIYYYLLGYRGVNSFSEIFGDAENDYKVCHADDLQYLFPVHDMLFPTKPPSEADKKVAKLLTTLFANFAKHGNPTPEINDVCKSKWEPVTCPDEMNYYDIRGPEDMGMEKGLYLERAKFWRTLAADTKRTEHIRDEL